MHKHQENGPTLISDIKMVRNYTLRTMGNWQIECYWHQLPISSELVQM